jgi:hypothetical protein
MSRTVNYGIRYPAMDSANLDGDIANMMTDIDTVLRTVEVARAATHPRNGFRISGGSVVIASGGNGNLSFTTENWDDNAHWAIGTPTVFNLPVGYWLVSANVLATAAAGTINYAAIDLITAGTNLIGQDQLDSISTASCWLSVTGLIKVTAASTFDVTCRAVSSGGANITFSGTVNTPARCSGTLIRPL